MSDIPVVKVGFFAGKPGIMASPSKPVQTVLKVVPPKPKPVYVPRPRPPRRLWDNYVVIHEVQKSDRIKYVLAAAVRDGVRYINVREFYFKAVNNEWRPSKDGITIPLTVPVNRGTKLIRPYGNLMIALKNVAKIALELPLYDAAHAVYQIKEEKEHED